MSRKIKRLPDEVVHRIAAGEILQRPSNAVKELLENSLDAGTSSISVTARDGGLKLLQIQDTGHGINKADLDIVCERFTTSKLENFEDLQSISTFGFRGEALASMSHVSRLSILTKTADSACAYKAHYLDGKLCPARVGQSSEPRASAGNNGTTITIEDLFYNVPTRLKAFKNVAEEYQRIVDCIARYSICYHNVSFSCRKLGANSQDVCTKPGLTALDVIKQLYPSEITRELVPVVHKSSSVELEIDGYVSNATYSRKKMTFVLFINKRLVESVDIKKALEAVYSRYLPKGGHPWAYLSLIMPAHRVDVNVHPTKKEVHFLDDDMVIDEIVHAITDAITESVASRTFDAPKLVASQQHKENILPVTPATPRSDLQASVKSETPSIGSFKRPIVPTHQLVRTDPKTRTLDSFVNSNSKRHDTQQEPVAPAGPTIKIELLSVQELLLEIKERESSELTNIFRNHSFVGCVDARRALVQHKTSLYMVDIQEASFALWYEVILNKFGNFSPMRFEEPLCISELLSINNPEFESADIVELIISRRDMLEEYFSLIISEDGCLEAFPILDAQYRPRPERIPHFCYLLTETVNWNEEKPCFESVSRCLAWLYQPDFDGDIFDNGDQHKSYRWTIEHVIFPLLRKFTPPSSLVETVTELAELGNLYKIFERC